MSARARRSLVASLALFALVFASVAAAPRRTVGAPAGQAASPPAQAQKPASSAPQAQDPGAIWDAAFLNPSTRYVRETNAFLAFATARILRENLCPGRTALDLGMGEGRNAIYLAQQGFKVTGLDVSKVAIQHAQEQAKAKGVTLETVEADLFAYDFGVDRFDLITLIYFNPAIKVLDKIKAAVKPGGLILIEGQGKDHEGGGPPPWSRFAPNQLVRAFDDWRVIEYQDGIYPCDWNEGKLTPVVRILARKPLAPSSPAAPAK
jgi:SAM-dependent methyltransferase